MQFTTVTVGEIVRNPLNPRKDFGEDADFRRSIVQQGLLQPLLCRPFQGNGKLELVAGERRLTAIKEAIKLKELPANITIPVMIQDRTDQQALQAMLTENLQRKDLSEYEQAVAFRQYCENDPLEFEASLLYLSEKTGVTPYYIRRRVNVLTLPQAILDKWQKRIFSYSHLEQFLRLNKEELILEFAKYAEEHKISTAKLKSMVDAKTLALSSALFSTKQCATCRNNTKVQSSLFGDDFKLNKVSCTFPGCFISLQQQAIDKAWPTIKKRKFTTHGGILVEGWDTSVGYFFGNVPQKCRKCDKTRTLFNTDLSVNHEFACTDKACYTKTCAEKQKGNNSSETPEQRQARLSIQTARKFSEAFLGGALPKKFESNSENAWAQASLLAICRTNRGILTEEMNEEWVNSIFEMSTEVAIGWIKKLSLQIVMSERLSRFEDRVRLATNVGLALGKDFVMDEAFLKRKTRAELLAMNRKMKISKLGMQDFKKKAIIAELLSYNLEGLVPKEIIDLASKIK